MSGASLESERSRGYFPGYPLVNRYELRRPLGEGGTGVVWVAHDRVLNLEVAVKLVRQFDASSYDFARRTQLEAASAARIAHPAVCRAIDFGVSAHGEPFVVSELLEGESLDDAIVRTGRLEATQAVRILLPILDALRAAHESGIVHRDVKPANIFLARDGLRRLQPKLLDFGIASWLGDPSATSEVGICGTPHYMSPEQARGDVDVDGRSDLWSFCATLYETLTGNVPFEGENHEAVLHAVRSVDPEPITTWGAGDDALSAIVLQGLRRTRDARWQSARELMRELCRWLLLRGVETDICDHSLRARLGDRAERDSQRDTPHAQVLPRYQATRGADSTRDGTRTGGSSGTGKRFWTSAASAAALVAAVYAFRAWPTPAPPLEATRVPASLVPPPAATLPDPVPPVVAPPGSVPDDRAANGVTQSGSPDANQAAAAPPSLPVPPVPLARTQRVDSASKGSDAGSTPLVAPTPTVVRPRSSNALNYDFGF